MNFRDIQKAADPKKILEGFLGQLGTLHGMPYGSFGDFAEFSPKAFFNLNDYYNLAGAFDYKDFFKLDDYKI